MASKAVTATAATVSPSIVFGIVLDINGTPVPISTTSLTNAKAQGVEFTLPSRVVLGSIDDFEKWISAKFSVSIPTAADLPSPLDKVVGAITGMQIAVEQLHVKVPGSSDTSGVGPQYTLGVSGTFQPEISLIDGKLGIDGMVFGVTNEPAAS